MLEEEPSYAALQREVQRKLGRCLLQIQQYELQLKAMVSKRDITAVLGRTSIQRVSTDQATDTKTMGQLVGELTGKYFQPTLLEAGQEQSETDTNSDTDSDDDGHPAGSVRVSMGVSMRPDAHAKLTAELQELVDLRNDLVHHFIERHDLMSEDGCMAADMYLIDCNAEIDRHLVALQEWALVMDDTKQSLAAFMTSSEFKDSLRAQLSTALSPQAAALSGLIEHLRIAEAEHAIDGWTALSAARGFIEKEVAEDLLQKADFGSWRQVLHEAGVFEVCRESAEPGGAKETWYRSRH